MKTSATFTATVPVHLFTRCWSVEELAKYIEKGDTDRMIGMLSFGKRSAHAEDEPGRYTEVGEARITITMHASDKLVALQIGSLESMLKAERAATVQRQNAIIAQISKLQAITYEAPEVQS